MCRISLVCGGFLVALGAVALLEALCMRDAWTGAPLVPALAGGLLVIFGMAHVWGPAAPVSWPDAAGARRVVGLLVLLALYVAVLPSDARK